MCWAVPAKVLEITSDITAKVDFGGGVISEVAIGDPSVKPGDLVMVHSGIIIGKITQEELLSNLKLYVDTIALEYTDQGMSEAEAIKNAVSQMQDLFKELGFDPQKVVEFYLSNRGEEEPEIPQVEEKKTYKVDIPPNAFRDHYKTALSDMDYLQVMHYTNAIRFCERAWMRLLESIGYSYTVLIHRFGLFIPTVEVDAKILSPTRMDNDLEVYVWVEEIGRKHLKYRCVIKNLTSGRIAADMTHVAVCTDTTLMESMELPKELKEKLRQFAVRQD